MLNPQIQEDKYLLLVIYPIPSKIEQLTLESKVKLLTCLEKCDVQNCEFYYGICIFVKPLVAYLRIIKCHEVMNLTVKKFEISVYYFYELELLLLKTLTSS